MLAKFSPQCFKNFLWPIKNRLATHWWALAHNLGNTYVYGCRPNGEQHPMVLLIKGAASWSCVSMLVLKCSVVECVLGSASSGSSSSTRNLWVSGLSSNTKAADLKNLFGKYGKVWLHLIIGLLCTFRTLLCYWLELQSGVHLNKRDIYLKVVPLKAMWINMIPESNTNNFF